MIIPPKETPIKTMFSPLILFKKFRKPLICILGKNGNIHIQNYNLLTLNNNLIYEFFRFLD